ncbi:alpha/beta fold hydrolase [Glaciihabitans tibetensis]|uniref:alpha/beta fold hydrolase n=1 Tax=Glaciihabitans tibetensis TaxID=1266600 RepID=UPI0015E650C3|nr:alpha/beta fold hydrolase [Glaciihabitans tibetensis]
MVSSLALPDPAASMLGRWLEVVAAVPHALAIEGDGVRFTFAEADALSDIVAKNTRHAVPDDGQPLGAMMGHDASAVIVAIAMLKIGRPLVMLDPHLPAERLRTIVNLVGMSSAVVARQHAGAAAQLDDCLTNVVAYDSLVSFKAAEHARDEVDSSLELELERGRAARGQDIFTIVFTSGSTGAPKGVSTTQDVVLSDVVTFHERLGFDVQDRVLMTLPLGYSAGTCALWAALLNGASVWCLDSRDKGVAAVVSYIRKNSLSVILCTPHLMRAIASGMPPLASLPSVRVAATVGEAVHGRDLRAIREHLGATAVLANWAGSSETGMIALHTITGDEAIPDCSLPAGQVVDLKVVTLVGEDGSPVKQGEVGSVVVTSDYTSTGYWGNEAQTAERFSVDVNGVRVYRLGDRGRFDGRGHLTLLGRADAAVKIRGYLVEPSETEAALLSLDTVEEAAVMANNHDGVSRLVAYVVPSAGLIPPSNAALRKELRGRLPEYMVPSEILQLGALPRTERGKVDRRSLPAVPARHRQLGLSAQEAEIAAIWEKLLALPFVNKDDDFLALGADSLSVEELLAVVEDRYRLSLRSTDLMNNPTLEQFARLIAGNAEASPSHPDVVHLSAGGGNEPLFCFAGAGALGLQFRPLARHFPERDVYAFQAHGLEERAMPDRTVTDHARRYLEFIRTTKPHGPYLLAGHSFGGLVALEVAHLLAEAGEEVELVALIDTYLPGTEEAAADDTPASDAHGVPTAPHRSTERLLFGLKDFGRHARSYLLGLTTFRGELQFQAFFDFTLRVARKYRVRPYAGRVLLVHAEDNPDGPDQWSASLASAVEFERVAALHEPILREPYATELARHLRKSITAGRAQ